MSEVTYVADISFDITGKHVSKHWQRRVKIYQWLRWTIFFCYVRVRIEFIMPLTLNRFVSFVIIIYCFLFTFFVIFLHYWATYRLFNCDFFLSIHRNLSITSSPFVFGLFIKWWICASISRCWICTEENHQWIWPESMYNWRTMQSAFTAAGSCWCTTRLDRYFAVSVIIKHMENLWFSFEWSNLFIFLHKSKFLT